MVGGEGEIRHVQSGHKMPIKIKGRPVMGGPGIRHPFTSSLELWASLPTQTDEDGFAVIAEKRHG
jgi:hypothetical protein